MTANKPIAERKLEKMTEAILSIGSNCGRREELVAESLRFLRKICSVEGCSPQFESPDMNGGERRYLNMILRVMTGNREEELNAAIKAFERECGRDDAARKRGDVAVDIDIIVWGGEIRRPKDYNSNFVRRGLNLLDGTGVKITKRESYDNGHSNDNREDNTDAPDNRGHGDDSLGDRDALPQ